MSRLVPLTRAEVRRLGPHFVADYCLRCSVPFQDGQRLVGVWGSGDAKYRDIGIIICRACQSKRVDEPRCVSIYQSGPRGNRPPWHAPFYYGARGITGFAKLAKLDNGVWRLGFHRGHVEVWTAKEVETIGRVDIGSSGYSADYGLYGSLKVLGPGAHREEERHFVDLSQPTPYPPEADGD